MPKAEVLQGSPHFEGRQDLHDILRLPPRPLGERGEFYQALSVASSQCRGASR